MVKGLHLVFIFLIYNKTGRLIWRRLLQVAIGGSAAIGVDQTIYIGAGTNMFAFYPSGSQKWSKSVGTGTNAAINGSPTVSYDSTVYVGTVGSGLAALKDNGFNNVTLLWRTSTSNAIATTPTLTANNVVLFGTSGSRLYAVNSKSGSVIWQFITGLPLYYYFDLIFCCNTDI